MHCRYHVNVNLFFHVKVGAELNAAAVLKMDLNTAQQHFQEDIMEI